MKIGILYGTRDIRVEEIETPKPGDGGMLVRVRACGICGSDLHAYKNASRTTTGIARGHEITGDVVEVGANVRDVKVGDRVFANSVIPCFKCEACKRKDYWQCPEMKQGGFTANGGFAEYLLVPTPYITKLTETMSYQDGALAEPTGVGCAVVNAVEPKTDGAAVVLGVGMVGLGAVAKLRALGVSKVIASDISEKRLEAAKELGADLVINPTEEDVVKRVMEETSGRGADSVIETAGLPVTFLQAIDMGGMNSRIGIVTGTEEPFEFNPGVLLRKKNRIIPVLGSAFRDGFEVVKAGGVKDRQVVSHAFPLDRINEAFETAINTKESVKVMIEP